VNELIAKWGSGWFYREEQAMGRRVLAKVHSKRKAKAEAEQWQSKAKAKSNGKAKAKHMEGQ
jgi:hypothetical protein